MEKVPERNKKLAFLFLNINLNQGHTVGILSPDRVAACQSCCETSLKLARHLLYFGIA